MSCTPSPIRREHQWSLSPQLLPSPLDWSNSCKASGSWTIMTTRLTHFNAERMCKKKRFYSANSNNMFYNKLLRSVHIMPLCLLSVSLAASSSPLIFLCLLIRVHLNCSCIQQPASVTLSGSMSVSCKR